MHNKAIGILLLLAIALQQGCNGYIADLKLHVCDSSQYACPTYPGYQRIPVDLNQGTGLESVYLDVKEGDESDAITGLTVVQGKSSLRSWTCLDTDLNYGAAAQDKELYLCYTKDKSSLSPAITSIIVKTGTHPVVAAEYIRVPINLNNGVGGESIYLFYSQEDGPKDPITAITAKACFTDNCYLEGWERVEKDVNEGVIVGMRVYLFYQRIKGHPPVTDVVVILDDQTPPEGYVKVDVDLNTATIRGASIHLDYKVSDDPTDDELQTAIQELAIEYGHASVVPFGWEKIPVDLNSGNNADDGFGEPTFLTIRRGYTTLPKTPKLAFNSDGNFKILQLADLHFTNEEGKCRDIPVDMECHGDSTTLDRINKLLDLEQPDLAVFTGDNIDGGGVSDARAATFKFAEPVIKRKIPWAAIFGNHDDENDLTREELYQVIHRMPYSVSKRGPLQVSGVGNYALQIFSKKNDDDDTYHAFTLYFVDSGAYTNESKQEYDHIKQDQLEWLQRTSASFEAKNNKPNALAFFHIPIWEYNDYESANPKLGSKREKVSSPSQGAAKVLETLKTMGDVRATGCGHDHVNDYCLDREGLYLCYGGGLGVGGYGASHLGWPRRARVWQLSAWGERIETWKRLDNDDMTMVHFQTLY